MTNTPRMERELLLSTIKTWFDEAEEGCLFWDEFLDRLRDDGVKLADLRTGRYVGIGRLQSFSKRMKAAESQLADLLGAGIDLEGVKRRRVTELEKELASLRAELDEYREDSDR